VPAGQRASSGNAAAREPGRSFRRDRRVPSACCADCMNSSGRILVADRDDAARERILRGLQQAGYEVTPAASGPEALRGLRDAGGCDLILLDLALPAVDGRSLCACLREVAGELLPIVAIAGAGDAQAVAEAYEAGATDFIAQPVEIALLAQRIRHLLQVQRALTDLRAAESRNRALLEAIPDLLFEVDADGRYLDYHAPRNDPLALARDRIVGRTVHEVLPEHAAKVCMAALATAAERGSSTGKTFKLELAHGEFWFELSVARKSDSGASPRFMVLSRNITERMAAEYRIRKMAFFDGLTGLPNRDYFMRRLDRHIRRARESDSKFAILFMDLDGFKNINDTLGHSFGDRLLRATARRLHHAMRPDDIVRRTPYKTDELELARLGGDEFISVVLRMTQREDALVVATRILTVMRQPFLLDERQVTLTTSIGIAVYPDDGADPATLLKHGDTAMYHAKDSGRDNCQFYSTTLTREAVRNLELDESLRVAEERNELALCFQPQLDVASEAVHSIEALVRWKHPAHGEVLPQDFIPLAERNGMILPIGRWIVRTACLHAAHWRRIGRPTRIAVNISALQWRDPRFVDMVFEALDDAQLPAELLELEMTETAVMENTSATLAKLRMLRGQGVRIALDDFGTGYSSLSYLSRIPLTSLKIDRGFVAGLPAASHNRAIVRAILAMARSLNLSVTAEGVETQEQANILHAMGCDVLQGFLFTQPVPAADVPALLDRRWAPLLGTPRAEGGAELIPLQGRHARA
jgi:diguanylate cyclase (GGDEF)-like protein/PAS domain S-box-containing protein